MAGDNSDTSTPFVLLLLSGFERLHGERGKREEIGGRATQHFALRHVLH